MNFIAHRGNLEGPNSPYENQFDYLKNAFDACGRVEVDIQTHNGELYLGHDDPQELVTHDIIEFLKRPGVYCHSKDTTSIPKLLTHECHTFFHQTDPVVFTSRGFIWCFPGVYVSDIQKSIWLDMYWKPLPQEMKRSCFAVCGDFWEPYR